MACRPAPSLEQRGQRGHFFGVVCTAPCSLGGDAAAWQGSQPGGAGSAPALVPPGRRKARARDGRARRRFVRQLRLLLVLTYVVARRRASHEHWLRHVTCRFDQTPLAPSTVRGAGPSEALRLRAEAVWCALHARTLCAVQVCCVRVLGERRAVLRVAERPAQVASLLDSLTDGTQAPAEAFAAVLHAVARFAEADKAMRRLLEHAGGTAWRKAPGRSHAALTRATRRAQCATAGRVCNLALHPSCRLRRRWSRECWRPCMCFQRSTLSPPTSRRKRHTASRHWAQAA